MSHKLRPSIDLPEHLSKAHFLNRTDASRAIAVMEYAIERFDLLSMISVDDASSDIDNAKKSNLDSTHSVGQILEDQKTLTARYEKLLADRSDKHMRSAEEINAREDEIKSLQNQIKENSRVLTRNLKEAPNESNNWKKVQSERSNLRGLLELCIKELQSRLGPQTNSSQTSQRQPQQKFKIQSDATGKGSIADHIHADMEAFNGAAGDSSYVQFISELYYEYQQKRYLDVITERERDASEKVKLLQVKVEEEKRLKEKEIEEYTVKLTEMNNDLRQLKELTAEESEKNKMTKEASFDTRRRVEARSLSEMNEETQRHKEQLDVEDNVHESMNGWLQWKTEQLKTEKETWEKKSEDEIGMKMQHMTALTTKREAQLKNLEDRKREYDEETRLKLEREENERNMAEEARLNEERKQREMVTRIMLAYKCYKARILLEQLMKEKGGKKRGKAKGKVKK